MVDDLGAVAGVGPCLGLVRAGRDVHAAGVVGDARPADPDGQEQAPGVSTPRWRLRPAAFLPASMPWSAAGPLAEVFTLCVQHPCGWLAVAAFSLKHQAAQETVELVENAFFLPCGEVAVDRLPWWEVVRQVPPEDVGAVGVEDDVHGAAQLVLRHTMSRPLPLCSARQVVSVDPVSSAPSVHQKGRWDTGAVASYFGSTVRHGTAPRRKRRQPGAPWDQTEANTSKERRCGYFSHNHFADL